MRLQRLRPNEWRIHVFSRGAVALFVGVLTWLGVLEMDPSTYGFLILGFLGYVVLVWRAARRAGAWLDWFSLAFDVMALMTVLQLSGRTASPLIVLVYLWLFAKLTMNVRQADAATVYMLAASGLLVLWLGTWGDERWGLFMSFQLLAVVIFVVISQTLLGERRRNERDPLTQVLHRGAGLERLVEKMKRNEPFDLAFIDLKGFKWINDTYGHAVGDEVLSGLAGRLLGCVRDQDLVIRYGGDEFLVVGPERKLKERLARLFSEPVSTSRGRIQAKGDIGVVTWEPDNEESLDALLARADAAMYRMKYTEPREDPHEARGGRPQRA
ncbi:MAG TPA: sensor domain-containing diguanylate cyclase [Oceanithermus profundus]|uniref:Sensor domain-containing diguanylate cyclase n=1 Tax=Oceanithermus profundus TaxID=187137 RepID=A0A7C4VKU3_9DEIN|nr:sensor domain-containing diguanylate cyclase [Oceanithermus profundus]